MIYNKIIEVLKNHNDSSLTKDTAIAITHHYGMLNKGMIALTVKYRKASDLSTFYGKFSAPNRKADITLTNLDEYGDPTVFANKELASNHIICMEHSEPSEIAQAIAFIRNDRVYLVAAGKAKDCVDPIPVSFDNFPLYPTEVIPVAKFKTKKGHSIVVLDYKNKELNNLIQKVADNTPINVLGFYSIPGRNGPIRKQSFAIWSQLSELYGCLTYNEIYEKEGINKLMVPVDMRGDSSFRKIGDMAKHHGVKDDGTPAWKKVGESWKKTPMAEYRQKCGADATIHEKGCQRLSKSLFPEESFMDFKVDHYAAISRQISIETHTYSPEEGWKEYGWLWKRNKGGYTTYLVDDMMYTFETAKLRAHVESHGKPEFKEVYVSPEKTLQVVEGNYHVNINDAHDTRTGMGKYGFFISLEEAARLAERVDPVLHAYVHDVALRAEAYKKLDDNAQGSKRRWVDRMVRKSEELKQRGA
ncbi:MAG: hypothetical protein ACRCUJ_12920 [Phocaeicola sp.]